MTLIIHVMGGSIAPLLPEGFGTILGGSGQNCRARARGDKGKQTFDSCMTVVSLLSDEAPEVIDLVSSSPPRNSPCSKTPYAKRSENPHYSPPRKMRSWDTSHSQALQNDFPLRPQSQPSVPMSCNKRSWSSDSKGEPSLRSLKDRISEFLSQPDLSSPGIEVPNAQSEKTIVDEMPPNPIVTSTLDDENLTKSIEPGNHKPSTAKRRRTFKEPAANESIKKAVATATITDRRRAAQNLLCRLWTADDQWVSDLEDQFRQLEVEASTTMNNPLDLEGVNLVMSVHGNYEDEWNDEHQTFIKTAAHNEDLGSAIVVIDPEFMDTLGRYAQDRREEYIANIRGQVSAIFSSKCAQPNILFMFPEVGVHFKRQVDKFNRAMRRRVVMQSQEGSFGEDTSLRRPDEQFYTNLETELQVVNGIKAHYPRKRDDCIEMIANCVLDFGFQRYHAHTDQQTDTYGGSVRSKVTLKDISVESLTKIQGLPPRIANSLAAEVASLGKLLNGLGSNSEMRASRVKRFGKGTWNTSLLKFLECEDPNAVI